MGESPKSAGEMTYDLVVCFNGLCLVLSICSVVCVGDNSTHKDNAQSQRVWQLSLFVYKQRKLLDQFGRAVLESDEPIITTP